MCSHTCMSSFWSVCVCLHVFGLTTASRTYSDLSTVTTKQTNHAETTDISGANTYVGAPGNDQQQPIHEYQYISQSPYEHPYSSVTQASGAEIMYDDPNALPPHNGYHTLEAGTEDPNLPSHYEDPSSPTFQVCVCVCKCVCVCVCVCLHKYE